MFDPKKAALLILSRPDRGDKNATAEDGSSGPEALKAMFSALKQGNLEVAYDAFRVAVESCGSMDESMEAPDDPSLEEYEE